MERKNIEDTLPGLISELKSEPYPVEDAAKQWFVELDGTEETNSRWQIHVFNALKTAKTFEIHCWADETECIDLALQYGKQKDSDWQYGKIITGDVTPKFCDFLLGLPKPTDTELYNKMTPFFTISLDNGFWSEHYGTELISTGRQARRYGVLLLQRPEVYPDSAGIQDAKDGLEPAT